MNKINTYANYCSYCMQSLPLAFTSVIIIHVQYARTHTHTHTCTHTHIYHPQLVLLCSSWCLLIPLTHCEAQQSASTHSPYFFFSSLAWLMFSMHIYIYIFHIPYSISIYDWGLYPSFGQQVKRFLCSSVSVDSAAAVACVFTSFFEYR